MKSQFDYKNYWTERLQQTGKKLTGVGHKRFSEKANLLMYKKTEEGLKKVLSRQGIRLTKKTVLDAGAGIGMFTGFYLKRGANVTAIDISSEALSFLKSRFASAATKQATLDQVGQLGKKFDIVHCFDVLYHVVDDSEWKKSVEALAESANEYLIVHDKYPYFGYQLFEKGHVKVRDPKRMRSILKKHNFEEQQSVATHLFYVRPMFYPAVAVVPEAIYLMDRFFLALGMSFLQTTYIRVFKKRHP